MGSEKQKNSNQKEFYDKDLLLGHMNANGLDGILWQDFRNVFKQIDEKDLKEKLNDTVKDLFTQMIDSYVDKYRNDAKYQNVWEHNVVQSLLKDNGACLFFQIYGKLNGLYTGNLDGLWGNSTYNLIKTIVADKFKKITEQPKSKELMLENPNPQIVEKKKDVPKQEVRFKVGNSEFRGDQIENKIFTLALKENFPKFNFGQYSININDIDGIALIESGRGTDTDMNNGISVGPLQVSQDPVDEMKRKAKPNDIMDKERPNYDWDVLVREIIKDQRLTELYERYLQNPQDTNLSKDISKQITDIIDKYGKNRKDIKINIVLGLLHFHYCAQFASRDNIKNYGTKINNPKIMSLVRSKIVGKNYNFDVNKFNDMKKKVLSNEDNLGTRYIALRRYNGNSAEYNGIEMRDIYPLAVLYVSMYCNDNFVKNNYLGQKREQAEVKENKLDKIWFVGDSYTVGYAGHQKLIDAKKGMSTAWMLKSVLGRLGFDNIDTFRLSIQNGNFKRPDNFPDKIMLLGGINDGNPTKAVSNIDKIVEISKLLGVKIGIGNYSSDNQAAKLINSALEKYRNIDGVEFVDFYKTISGPKTLALHPEKEYTQMLDIISKIA